MSIRRSFALAGAVALVSSIVLGGAQGALAVGTAASPSATASATAPAKGDKAAHQSLDLSVHGVPNEFFAGGDAREFTFKVGNSTAHDFSLYPLLKLKSNDGKLRAKDFKVEYQLPGATTWSTGTSVPGGDGDDDASLILLGDDAVEETSAITVKRATAATIKVRLSFTSGSPLGKAGVVPVAFFVQLDDTTGKQIGNGEFSCDGIKGAAFHIRAPKPTPTKSPKPTPTKSPKPTPTKSSSATASPSATVSPSATASATASPSATVKPSETATPSESASPSATSVPSETAKPSETAEPSESASPSATATESTTAAPSASTPAPSVSSSSAAQLPIDFPVATPGVTLPALTPAVIAKATVVSDAAAPAKGKDLAQTGGGSDSTPIAIGGAAVLAAGVGTLVVLRRRKGAQQG